MRTGSMATHEEPMPKWFEEELGLVRPAKQEPVNIYIVLERRGQ